jgi:hypothetical protein
VACNTALFLLVIANDPSQRKKLFFPYVKKVKKINRNLSLIFKHKTGQSIRRQGPPTVLPAWKVQWDYPEQPCFFRLSHTTGTVFRSRKRGQGKMPTIKKNGFHKEDTLSIFNKSFTEKINQ